MCNEHTMNDALTGKVTIPKMMLDRDILTAEPANRKSALVDLHAWANDRERSVKIGGGDVHLKRGQLAYSQQTLSKLWRWDKDKTHRVLTEFQNEGLITFDGSNRTTIITVVDYTIYNADTDAKPAAEPEAVTEAQPDAKPEQKLEVGSGSKKGEGAEPPRIISLDMALEWFDKNVSGYTHDQIGRQWLYYDAMRDPDTGHWRRPGRNNGFVFISDWRSELSRSLATFADSPGSKASVFPVEHKKKAGPVWAQVRDLREATEKLRQALAASPLADGGNLSFYTKEEMAALRKADAEVKAKIAVLEKQLAEISQEGGE